MTINYYQSVSNAILIGGYGTVGTNTGHVLDSNFTLGSAGDCVGHRFVAPLGGVHIHSVYWFLNAANATSHDLVCHLCAYNSASSTRPNTTPIRSVSVAGGTTANKWIKFDFSAYTDALTAGEIYWLVIGDATGNGSSYSPRIRSDAELTCNGTGLAKINNIYTSTDGFATSGTSGSATLMGSVVVFSDDSALGTPYTQSINVGSFTVERGLKFIFDEKVTCSGVLFNSTSVLTDIKMYTGSTSPGGTVWSGFNGGAAHTLTTTQKVTGFYQFPTAITFAKNTYYRVILKSTLAIYQPGWSEVEDYSTLETNALKTLMGSGSWCYTVDNGSGGWTDYNNATDGYRIARMALVLQSQVEIPTGGGSGTGGGVWSFGG